MKTIKILVSLLLALILLVINVPCIADAPSIPDYVGLLEPTQEELDWIDENSVEYGQQQLMMLMGVLPDAVDNSDNKYFPEIGYQTTGSCSAWASTYYGFTYEWNKTMDTDASDLYNTFNPMWTYNAQNNGVDHGSSIIGNLKTLKYNGAADTTRYPITNNYKFWPTSQIVWKHAIKKQIDQIYYMNRKSPYCGPAELINLSDINNELYAWPMFTGLNTFSTPIQLHEKIDTWGEFKIRNMLYAKCSLIRRWNAQTAAWITCIDSDPIIPGEGYIVTLTEDADVTIAPDEGISSYSSKTVYDSFGGWNLVGVSTLDPMPIDEYLESVYMVGQDIGYTQAYKPAYGEEGWTYNRGAANPPLVYPGDAIWIDMENGPANLIGFTTTPFEYNEDWDIINLIRQCISDGHIVMFSTYVNSWVFGRIKDDPNIQGTDPHVSEGCCLYLNGTEGSHAMTIVGYDDNIWVDINGNTVVDNGEKGAFKIANSWGTGDYNDGFRWLSYDATREISIVPSYENQYGQYWPPSNKEPAFSVYHNKLYTFTVKNEDPEYKLNITITTNSREDVLVQFGTSVSNENDWDFSTPPPITQGYYDGVHGGEYGHTGLETGINANVLFDISDGVVYGATNWFLKVTNRYLYPCTITNFKIYKNNEVIISWNGNVIINNQTYTWKFDYDVGVPTYTYNLVEGWNMISVPYQTQVAPATFFSSISEDIEVVWHYDSDPLIGWQLWGPGSGPWNINYIEDGKAYWIDMNAARTFTIPEVLESSPPTISYTVVPGWNHIGYKAGLEEMNICDYLYGTVWSNAWEYDSQNVGDEWRLIFPGWSDDLNMKPGLGYWVYFEEAGTIYPPVID
ncbi:MAG: hypothetical protein PHC43_00055 [Candidatus Marinimicrobia bacterium]|nr:hypothetical protein [Candidatus Neomarinimicrobiota bacterium]